MAPRLTRALAAGLQFCLPPTPSLADAVITSFDRLHDPRRITRRHRPDWPNADQLAGTPQIGEFASEIHSRRPESIRLSPRYWRIPAGDCDASKPIGDNDVYSIRTYR